MEREEEDTEPEGLFVGACVCISVCACDGGEGRVRARSRMTCAEDFAKGSSRNSDFGCGRA